MTITISSGAHWRNTDIEPSDEPRVFAHIFDAESPEDVPHEASNFLLYMRALGGCESVVLLRPEDDLPPWVAPIEAHSARHFGPEEDHVEVMLADWKMIVESCTGLNVEIQ